MKATDTWRALTLRQPWADLVMAGVKDVENRTWPVPSTLPQWYRCALPQRGHVRREPAMVERTGPRACDVSDGPFPFRLWVHAGQEVAWRTGPDALNLMLYHAWEAWNGVKVSLGYGPRAVHPRNGMLMGHVTVTGCHHADDCLSCTECGEKNPHAASHEPAAYEPCSRWADPDVWHWTLTDPDPLPEPIPMRGRQGLWHLPADLDLTP